MTAPSAIPQALREDDVVAAIARIVATPSKRVLLGIGDDAALWQPSRSHRSVITSDMLVEGIHFAATLMTLEDAGWRAMMANASDLAAMGARPLLATVALGVPAGAGCDDVAELYRGLSSAATAAGIDIVGGDLSRCGEFVVSIAAVGEVRPSNVKLRSGGRPGAVLAVTGPLGASRAGLELARRPRPLEEAQAAQALAAFRRPVARCLEGQFLAASRNVQAMMDCSDGLSTDVARLCAASGCGAQLDAIPIAPSARALSQALGEDAQRFALAGGEDFELLVAVAPRAFPHLAHRFATRFGRPLERIGTLAALPGVTLHGKPIGTTGWDHFA